MELVIYLLAFHPLRILEASLSKSSVLKIMQLLIAYPYLSVLDQSVYSLGGGL